MSVQSCCALTHLTTRSGRGGRGSGAKLGANAVAQHGEGLSKYIKARCPDDVYHGLTREQKSWLALKRKKNSTGGGRKADISSVVTSIAQLSSTVSALDAEVRDADDDGEEAGMSPKRKNMSLEPPNRQKLKKRDGKVD